VDYQKTVSIKIENRDNYTLKPPEVQNVFWINWY
jgi:hypothetical protein